MFQPASRPESRRSLPSLRSRHDTHRNGYHRRLRCEPLEDRRMLSVFTVTNTNDGPVAAAGDLPGSLRQAIFNANANPGDDVVLFDASLSGQTITLTNGVLTVNDATGSITITGLGANVLTVSGSSASGVFVIAASSVAEISGLTITGGFALNGAGISNQGFLELSGCAVSGNTAPGTYGGGILNDNSLEILDSTINGNSGYLGGGIANRGQLTITTSTVYNNEAFKGGGIYNDQATTGVTLTVYDSTIAANSAVSGGGLWDSDASYVGTHTIAMSNTLVADNAAIQSGADIYCNYAVTANYCLVENTNGFTFSPGSGNNLVNVDPKLGTLGDHGGTTPTVPLLAGSPAIDAGSNALIPAGIITDQRGSDRIVNNRVDLGAYEFKPDYLILGTGDFNGDGIADILCRDQVAGTVGVWRVSTSGSSGSTVPGQPVTGGVWTVLGQPDPAAWIMAGIGDFNGDGTDDLLWHNQNNGLVGTWILRNAAFSRWTGLGQTNYGTWHITGVGDFNGDGTSDVLWQNQSNGTVGTWIIRNAAYSYWAGFGAPSLALWGLSGVGDFDRDGTDDVLWRNKNDNTVGAWMIRNAAFSRWVSFGQLE